MPENYYCLDNFFQKLTNMESPRKNNDCYFYYYSTCTKGDSCTFRHEPSALGCETVCSFWKEGKCINVRCNLRHMELRKNRKAIPCYWESQPGGCLKPHCPFLHQSTKHPSLSEGEGEPSDLKTQELKKENTMKGNEKNFESPVVDPLVVNFEEESDNESAPTFSPIKTQRTVKVKTLEEIKLEKIQAESAAYYSYADAEATDSTTPTEASADDLRQRILTRMKLSNSEPESTQNSPADPTETRKRKQKSADSSDEVKQIKRQKATTFNSKSNTDISKIKVKTLAEIRAEKASKSGQLEKNSEIADSEITSTNSEVTSTSSSADTFNNENSCIKTQSVAKIQPIMRLKRKHSTSLEVDEKKRKLSPSDQLKEEINDTVQKEEVDSVQLEHNHDDDLNVLLDNQAEFDSTKLDEVLLLDDEDLEANVTLKAEEDILKDIDQLLNE